MKKIAIAFIFMLIFIGGLKLESSAVTAQCGMCKKNVHTSCSKMKYESKGGSTHVNTCCCGSTWYDGCSSWKWSSSSHIKTCGLC